MFIRADGVTYIETQFNHLKLHKIVKNGKKRHRTLKKVLSP